MQMLVWHLLADSSVWRIFLKLILERLGKVQLNLGGGGCRGRGEDMMEQ